MSRRPRSVVRRGTAVAGLAELAASETSHVRGRVLRHRWLCRRHAIRHPASRRTRRRCSAPSFWPSWTDAAWACRSLSCRTARRWLWFVAASASRPRPERCRLPGSESATPESATDCTVAIGRKQKAVQSQVCTAHSRSLSSQLRPHTPTRRPSPKPPGKCSRHREAATHIAALKLRAAQTQ